MHNLSGNFKKLDSGGLFFNEAEVQGLIRAYKAAPNLGTLNEIEA
jgi:hypothetical protein